MITGYWVEIPEGATSMGSVNSEEIGMSFADYAELVSGIYTAETPTEYGTFEWDDSEEIKSVVINDTACEVHELIGGAHAPQRPK